MDNAAKAILSKIAGIPTVEINNTLYAMNEWMRKGQYGFNWVNISKFSAHDFKSWLGY